MSHVKQFGTIDTLQKSTLATRGKVRSWDLGQAERCEKIECAGSGIRAVALRRDPLHGVFFVEAGLQKTHGAPDVEAGGFRGISKSR